MADILNGLGHAAVYAAAGTALLVAAYFVLDLLTPGHLGAHLHGSAGAAAGADGAASHSAGLVSAAWLVSVGGVLFTAIWTNGETSLGLALLATVLFGAVGIALNVLALLVVDAATPGNLRAIVCLPGRAVPLAYVAASASLAVGAVVSASIA
jgi:hypothetical protein